MARPKNRTPKATSTKLYAVWCKVRDNDQSWKEFSNFADSVGLPPTHTHFFSRKNKTKPYSPSNFIWLAKGQRLPLGATSWPKDTTPPFLTRENAYINGLRFGTYFGDGLWNAVCRTCKTVQVAYETGTCPVCEAARKLAEAQEEMAPSVPSVPTQGYMPTTKKEAKAKAARLARYYYALNKLKTPSRHGSEHAYTEYIQNLPTNKNEREAYVLNYWKTNK